MLLAKPYHSLQAHLEDAYAVFQILWSNNQKLYDEWSRKNQLDSDEVYFLLGLGVYLHDIGKANPEWQTYLKSGQKRTKISHPLLSFAVLWELFRSWEGDEFYQNPLLRSILTAVLAHHHMLHNESYEHVRRQLGKVHLPESEVNEIIGAFLEGNSYKSFVPFTTVDLSWSGSELSKRVGIIRQMVNLSSRKEQIYAKVLHSFFLSLICQCDHISSGISEALHQKGQLEKQKPALVQISAKDLEQWITDASLPSKHPVFSSPNPLQQKLIENISPYMVLRAGCGEGKTGAALRFAKHWLDQKKVNRVIFTLPTRFTINSMYQDFIHPRHYAFPKEKVGLYHSDALRILKWMRADESEDIHLLWRECRSQVYKNSIFQPTLTITTIDHLLYSLLHAHKNADFAFGNIQQSVIIFDEMHFYEQYTMKKIGECFRLLKEMKIPHLIMSATLSEAFLEKINKIDKRNPYVLVENNENQKTPFIIQKATEPLFTKEAGLSEEAKQIIQEHSMFRQMIITNQVERAKAITKALIEIYPEHNILCYHSEFAPIDRARKEECIKILFKPSKDRTSLEVETLESMGYQNHDQVILVSTQICELSLDISADIQLVDLAPVDALSQRGGRLHRKGISPDPMECRCSQCRLKTDRRFKYKQVIFPLDPNDKNAGYPYCDHDQWMGNPENMLLKSWEIIGDQYCFTNVKKWVNQLYPDCENLSDRVMRQYILEDAVFGKRPIDRFGKGEFAEESEGSFQVRQSQYRTVEVLPSYYRQEIMKRILDQSEFPGEVIKDYLVSMKAYRFGQCKKNEMIEMTTPINDCTLIFVNIPYDPNGIGFDFENGTIQPSFTIL